MDDGTPAYYNSNILGRYMRKDYFNTWQTLANRLYYWGSSETTYMSWIDFLDADVEEDYLDVQIDKLHTLVDLGYEEDAEKLNLNIKTASKILLGQ